jgi:hypothetical protein
MSGQSVLEVVPFRTKEGIADTAFLHEAAVVQAWIERQPGFINRELLKTPENQWLDMVRWASLELAQQASDKFMNADDCKPFMAMLDETGMQMWHFESRTFGRCTT